MRLPKYFILLLVLVSAYGMGYGQSQQPEVSQERDVIKSVHLFPMPAVEFLHIKVEDFEASKIKVTVHNIIGNEMDIETEVVDEHELRVRVKDLASGYYLLALKDNESKFRGTYKFLKR